MTKLIVVAAGSDDVTVIGAQFVRKLTDKSNIQCFDGQAVSVAVQKIMLSNPGRPVFFTGHGRPGFWRGTDNRPVICSVTTPSAIFKDRTLFALACWTGCHLGIVAANFDAIYIGYSKPISVIPASKKTAQIILDYLKKLFELIEALAESGDIKKFESQMERLGVWGERQLFNLVHLNGIYTESAVAIQQWSNEFVVKKKGHLSSRTPRLLQALLNEGSCADECFKDGLSPPSAKMV